MLRFLTSPLPAMERVLDKVGYRVAGHTPRALRWRPGVRWTAGGSHHQEALFSRASSSAVRVQKGLPSEVKRTFNSK